MIWLYRLLFIPLLLLSLPYYLLRMLRRGGYRKDFQHRFGRHKALPACAQGKTRLWIQAVSVGEVGAVTPLLEQLHASGRFEVVLTTTTSTGYRIAREKLRPLCKAIGVFPLDFAPFNALAWSRLKPDAVLLMESELWPEHCHRARKKGVPLYLINARLSDRSFRRYSKLPAFARWMLSKPTTVLASTAQDAERLSKLGVPPERLSCVGNMKFDVASTQATNPTTRRALLEELGFIHDPAAPEPLVLLGSSTWAGEEALLLETFEAARAQGQDVRLLLVPRHAERRGEITPLLDKQALPWHLRSTGHTPTGPVHIHLADTTGELTRLSLAADVAFIGKSLPPHDGGQTPIECAALGKAMIYGPCMTNFRELCRSLEAAQAARKVEDPAQAKAAMLHLLNDTQARTQLAQNARNWHASHKGATAKVFNTLLKHPTHP